MSDNASVVKELSPQEWTLTNAIEQCYHLDGNIPSVERLHQITGIPKIYIEKAYSKTVVVESLTLRGIHINESPELLSPVQLAALALFFDTKDGRSLKKKLSDIDVSTQQWNAWKADPKFSGYLRSRAEQSLQTNIAETEVALMDSAHRGDMSAIKLHLEMAGRWSSKTVGELNIEFLLMKILEAAQRTIKDQDMLTAFANEVMVLVPSPQQETAQIQNREVI